MDDYKVKCCLCGKEIMFSESNNAEPLVKNGRCCSECDKKVMAARMKEQ